MIVLHAHWCPSEGSGGRAGLVLWSESDPSAARPSATEAGRPRLLHPFTLPPDRLRFRLSPWLSTIGPDGIGDRRIVLQLPSREGWPQASPGLAASEIEGTEAIPLPGSGPLAARDRSAAARRGPDDPPAPIGLRLWAIDGLSLDPRSALEFLVRLPSATSLPRDLIVSDDLRFWQAAARLALELLAREALLPGLRRRKADGAWLSAWTTAPSMHDLGRIDRLANAMPAVCRADGGLREAPGARILLEDFLNDVVDAACRNELEAGATASASAGSSLIQAWLAGLSGQPQPLPSDTPEDPGELDAALSAWQADRLAPRGEGWHLALRLQAPAVDAADAAADWRLHFLLQAEDDPDLVAPAAAAWQAGETALELFGRTLARPAATLDAGLAWAARLAPALRRARARKHPRGVRLKTREARAFLEEAMPALREAGIAVEPPEWWDAPEARLSACLRMETPAATAADGDRSPGPRSNGGRLASPVDFWWEVRLGDRVLDADALSRLASTSGPLLSIGGRWLRVDPFQLRAARRLLAAGRQPETFSRALAYRLGAETTVAGLPLASVEARGDLSERLAGLEGPAAAEDPSPPPGLRADLRPYQQRGLAWLVRIRELAGGAILADDMGLGKTLQSLALLAHLRHRAGGRLPGPVLLVAPTSVVTSWAREAERWLPGLRVAVHQGPERPSGRAFASRCADAELLLTSYALLRQDRRDIDAIDWYGLIFDEAQQLKNPGSQLTRAARSLRADWRLALTGTPIENRLGELWSLFEVVLPGYLGPRARFRREIAVPIERHGDGLALRRLRRLTAPFLLRRLKRDPGIAAELPAKQEVRVDCRLGPEQVLLYQSELERSMAGLEAEAEGMARRGRILAMLTRLKQICNHPAQRLGLEADAPVDIRRSGKLRRLVALLEELSDEGEAALIFTQYRVMGDLLRRALRDALGEEPLFLHGGLSAAGRDRLIRRFQDDPRGPRLLILSLKAGGTGLTLTRASHVFHYDRWWNPAVEDQATDRAHRIGQARAVTVHRMICQGTVEERIDALLEQKRGLAEQVIGRSERWLTDLSIEALRRLVELGDGVG